MPNASSAEHVGSILVFFGVLICVPSIRTYFLLFSPLPSPTFIHYQGPAGIFNRAFTFSYSGVSIYTLPSTCSSQKTLSPSSLANTCRLARPSGASSGLPSLTAQSNAPFFVHWASPFTLISVQTQLSGFSSTVFLVLFFLYVIDFVRSMPCLVLLCV